MRNALGPFELWDALGFEATARRIEAEGRALPGQHVSTCCGRGAKSFYRAPTTTASRTPNTSIWRADSLS